MQTRKLEVNGKTMEMIFHTSLPKGKQLSLTQGDLTEQSVDAIVNAANVGLIHGGGVAGAIVRKGGSIIQTESLRIRRPKTGEAAITGAGQLPCRFVIHAVGPVWGGQSPEESDRLLTSATVASLEIARAKKLNSIAFPPVSSGIFGFPKDRCARAMVEAVVEWVANHTDDGPTDLRFVIIDDATVIPFIAYLRQRFPEVIEK